MWCLGHLWDRWESVYTPKCDCSKWRHCFHTDDFVDNYILRRRCYRYGAVHEIKAIQKIGKFWKVFGEKLKRFGRLREWH